MEYSHVPPGFKSRMDTKINKYGCSTDQAQVDGGSGNGVAGRGVQGSGLP